MSTGRARWKPDGWDAGVRIGVLAPHADVGPESRAAGDGAGGSGDSRRPGAFRAGYVQAGAWTPRSPWRRCVPSHSRPTSMTRPSYLPPHHCTRLPTASRVGVCHRRPGRGRDDREAGTAHPRHPRSTNCAATIEGLLALAPAGSRSSTHPWFDAELHELGRRYYESAGFDVIGSAPCALPSDQAKITPADLHDWVREQRFTDADAVVIGGNGFRAVGVIAALEEHLQRAVVTANQALLWAALRAAGADPGTVEGYRRLFSHA